MLYLRKAVNKCKLFGSTLSGLSPHASFRSIEGTLPLSLAFDTLNWVVYLYKPPKVAIKRCLVCILVKYSALDVMFNIWVKTKILKNVRLFWWGGSLCGYRFAKESRSVLILRRCLVPSVPRIITVPPLVQHLVTPNHLRASKNSSCRPLVRSSNNECAF